MESLLNKVGENNARKLLDCRDVTVAFDTDDKCATITANAPALKVWKTITIGNVQRDKFIATLKERNVNVSDWTVDMMKRDAFTVVEQEEQIDLVNVSVSELGFYKVTRYDAICARA